MQTSYPWWAFNVRYLKACCENNRLPLSVLLAGPVGLGKGQFAQMAAKYILQQVEYTENHAVALDAHPDFYQIKPAERQSIGVDDIRLLAKFIALQPKYGQRKLVVIHEANQLTLAAQNACLKLMDQDDVPVTWIFVERYH